LEASLIFRFMNEYIDNIGEVFTTLDDGFVVFDIDEERTCK